MCFWQCQSLNGLQSLLTATVRRKSIAEQTCLTENVSTLIVLSEEEVARKTSQASSEEEEGASKQVGPHRNACSSFVCTEILAKVRADCK